MTTTVTISGGSTRVSIGSGAAKRIALDQRTVAAITTNRPKTTVLAQSQQVAVSSRPTNVTVGGAMGVQGPAGADGTPAYEHTQSVAAITWTINHNLGYRPAVELRTQGGQEFDADVQHPTVNQTVVTLNTALAGYARLN